MTPRTTINALISTAPPSTRQVEIVRAAVAWYLRLHHAQRKTPGTGAMFSDPARVGAFAVDPAAIAAGEGASLFRILVATAMFQRRQDQQILRILRGIAPETAMEITTPERLRSLVAANPCPHAKSVEGLRERCDLTKDPRTGQGICGERPLQPCHLKEHTGLDPIS